MHLTRREWLGTWLGKWLGGCLAAAAALAAGPAAADGWQVLGRRAVRPGVDRDRIAVDPGAGPFTRLRLEVADNGITLRGLRVTFANGDRTRFALADSIPAGGRSRSIDLPGGPRRIAAVDLSYVRRRGGGVAVVTLQGYAV
jgi:hypothetical protein